MGGYLAPVLGHIGTAWVGLVVALVIGVLAGRAKGRFVLLLAGVAVAVVGGVVVTSTTAPVSAGQPARIEALYTLIVPLLIAFVAGWLLARGGWVRRAVVIVLAVVALAAFPYPAAAAATARMIGGY